MAIERVREYLKQWNAQDRIQEFEVSSATVELAAQALHCEGKRIAKTPVSYTHLGGSAGGKHEYRCDDHILFIGDDIAAKTFQLPEVKMLFIYFVHIIFVACH